MIVKIQVGKQNGEQGKFFGPLSFTEVDLEHYIHTLDVDELLPCILCEDKFVLPSKNKEFIQHLYDCHRLLISDLHHIVDLKSYFRYWKDRFASLPVTDVCHVIEQQFSSHSSYVLGAFVEEDKTLREKLQRKRLEAVLACQDRERQDKTFSRECLLCKTHLTGTRANYFNHLATIHNLKIGHPDNLVFTDELIDKLHKTLERLQCLYCEKYFKKRESLKEHMRKKQHKSINPDNKCYDKFYVVNYLELGRNWRDIQAEKDSSSSYSESDSEEEKIETEKMASGMPFDATGTVTCLFCNEISASFEDALEHMDSAHEFDYSQIVEDNHLSFYEQVKLVNYIRHQMYALICMKCHKLFQDRGDLLNHMTKERHFMLPRKEVWNQPEYYFPTYENDNFLCNLDADEGITKKMKTCSTHD
ncbi:zinc finger protein 277 isoform X1 [Schistocerca gregaria]|uniref:zinc finger protein 277 isoform X1 n=1 Tax=Schistocerca gregaria TaxID=7010 RepID=UPI00211E3E4B|nr:zinc finger protein 277 isoform X1 [Schistocerca gregaria]